MIKTLIEYTRVLCLNYSVCALSSRRERRLLLPRRLFRLPLSTLLPTGEATTLGATPSSRIIYIKKTIKLAILSNKNSFDHIRPQPIPEQRCFVVQLLVNLVVNFFELYLSLYFKNKIYFKKMFFWNIIKRE